MHVVIFIVYRVIYITGSESEVSLAQSLVWEMIGQQTFDSDGSLGLGWEPAKAKDSPGEYDKYFFLL